MEENKGLPYFFLGLGIGVAVGMIFAPQAGGETRTMLKTKAEEGTDYLKRRSGDLRSSASEIVERGKQVVNRQKERVSSSVEAGKQAYRDTMEGQPQPGSTMHHPAEGI
jgi:gas vesicle protein